MKKWNEIIQNNCLWQPRNCQGRRAAKSVTQLFVPVEMAGYLSFSSWGDITTTRSKLMNMRVYCCCYVRDIRRNHTRYTCAGPVVISITGGWFAFLINMHVRDWYTARGGSIKTFTLLEYLGSFYNHCAHYKKERNGQLKLSTHRAVASNNRNCHSLTRTRSWMWWRLGIKWHGDTYDDRGGEGGSGQSL